MKTDKLSVGRVNTVEHLAATKTVIFSRVGGDQSRAKNLVNTRLALIKRPETRLQMNQYPYLLDGGGQCGVKFVSLESRCAYVHMLQCTHLWLCYNFCEQ